jgi:hypothetical protein
MSIRRIEVALTLGDINKALRSQGVKDKLVKGRGYFYFVGDASAWPDNAVHVHNVSDLDLDAWIAHYERLKLEADPEHQNRLNEERYGLGRPRR